MAPASSSTPAPATFHTGARLIGALNAAVTLGAAVLMAYGLADVARRRVGPGLALLVGAVALRWVLAAGVARWSEHVSATIRDDWRG